MGIGYTGDMVIGKDMRVRILVRISRGKFFAG
jgi:hypothetical protein